MPVHVHYNSENTFVIYRKSTKTYLNLSRDTLIFPIILSNIWQSTTFPYIKEERKAAKLKNKKLFYKSALLILTVSRNAFHLTNWFLCFSGYHAATNSVAPSFCIYSCFEKGCPTKPYATMPKVIMGNGFMVLDQSFGCFSDIEGNSINNVFMLSLFLLVYTGKPNSINANLFLPIIPIGIVEHAFTLLWDNLCRNSCKPHTTHYSLIHSYEGLSNLFTVTKSPYQPSW